jgi:HK97 family phage major capsid protein
MKDENVYQDRLAELRGRIGDLVEEGTALGEAGKDISADDLARLEEIEDQVTYLREQVGGIELKMRLADNARPGDGTSRQTAPRTFTQRTPAADPRFGFASIGEFALACRSVHGAEPDARLAQMASASTYSSEGAGADGSFLVPPEFSTNIMKYVSDQPSLFSLCKRVPCNNHLLWPVDEEAPWSSSGPQAYWTGEAGTITQSKIKVDTNGQKLAKLTVLCPVTDELIEDAPQLSAYLEETIARRMRWKVDDKIINGTGAGMPLGILNAPCLKTASKDGSQTATTVTSGNVFNIWNAVYSDFRSGAVWVANQDIETQLLTMVIAGTSSDVPVWLPAGSPYANAANAPNGTLMGRRLLYHQALQTLGTAGDILCADFSQYVIGYKTLGPNMATSIHFWFDQNLQAVRATWRLAGMPIWSKAISANNGSATYSPFAIVETRS